jgi:FG-GAP-like repeat/Bacterial Ig-like domain (group 3)
MKTARFVRLFAVLAFVPLLIVLAAAQSKRFGAPVTYGVDGLSSVVADLNGDGHPDLVVVNFAGVSVMLGNAEGFFEQPVAYNTGGYYATSVAVGDLNGDGHPDIVASNDCLDLNNCTQGVVGVLLGNGDGTFQAPVTYSTGAGEASSVAIADLDGDGHPDLVTTGSCIFDSCPNGSLSVLLGKGDGTFLPPTHYNLGGYGTSSLAIGDLNGDGHPDIAVVDNSSTVSVLLGNGDGTFQSPVAVDAGAGFVALGDVNGDGHMDLIVLVGGVSVLLGNGNGTFQAPVTYSTGAGGPNSVAIADLDGDGHPDLVVTSPCNGNIGDCHNGSGRSRFSVLSGNGDGTFQSPMVYGVHGYDAQSVAAADLNGDGKPDLIITNRYGYAGIAVFFNGFPYCTTTKVRSSQNPSHVGQSVTFTATITSTSGAPAFDGDFVSFYNGKTQIGFGYTKGGVATLTTTFSTAGKYSIKAKFAGDRIHGKSAAGVRQVINP